MLNLCNRCHKPLEEGDKVSFIATGLYHHLPSIRSWAVDQGSVEADIRSIHHLICDEKEGD